jgi:nucleolar complex protein 3
MSKRIDNNYTKVYDSCKLVFEEDKLGENSLLITKTLLRLMKNKDYNIPSETIELLNYLNLNLSVGDKVDELTTNDDPKQHHKNGKKNKRVIAELSQHVSKKQKKKQKVDKELADELREAEAEYTREEVSKFQSETLKQVFIIYFRILKTNPPSPLIPTVLDGLINFAHLINIDLFPDLFPYLKSLLYKEIPSAKPSLHLELDYLNNRLKCIHCCFRLLNDEIVGLNLDLKPFYDELYKILLIMTTFGHGGYDELTEEISKKLILCLNSAFIEGVKVNFTLKLYTIANPFE